MTAGFLVRRAALPALALALLVPAPVAQARSKPDPAKMEQKVEKKLAHYKKGTLLHLVFAGSTESTGTLGQLGEHSFTLVNVDTNATETHNYLDVESVGKGSDTVGGRARSHHGIL
jgi:hypothetical protein